MANIDNLNFKVILDDQDFNTRIKADIKLAEKLNTQLSSLLQAKTNINKMSAQDAASAKRQSDILARQAINQEKINQAAAKTAEAEERVRTQAAKTATELEKARKAASEAALAQQRIATEAQRTAKETTNASVASQRLRTEAQRTATEVQRTATNTANAANATARAQLAQKRLRDYSAQTASHIRTQSRLMNELKGYALGYLSVHGATQLLSSLVRVTGEFELQKTTLAAMLGSLNEAEQVITKIQGLAVESPFQFKELTTYAKQLSAFSVPAEELFETTKMLADISAGLGVGMDRIVLAYGQVRSAAFLRGQEVRQFTEAGIPILEELAKQFTELEGRAISTGEVFDRISARLVPFEMVAKVLKDLTSEGGKFYNMQEVQAETLRGKISNLKDAYEVMLNEIGEGQSEKLKGAVDGIRQLMQNYEDTGKSLVSLIAAYGAYKVALISIKVLTGTYAIANNKLLSSLKSVAVWVAKNPYALLAAGIGGMVGLVYKAATEQTTFEKSLSITNETLESFNSNVEQETGLLKYLLDRLSKLTVGTTEYNDVKSQILKNYGQYLTEVDKERLAVGDLKDMYDKLSESILDANRQKALSEGNARLSQQFTTEYNAIFDKFDTTIKALGIKSKDVRTALSDFVRGDIGLEDLPDEALKAVKEAQARINAVAYTPGGMFGNGISFAGFDFKVLRNDLKEAEEIIEEARNNLSDDLRVLFGPLPKVNEGLEKQVDGWRKTVQDTLKGLGLNKGTSFGLWAEDTTQSTTYVEDMIKRYKELKEEIKWVSTFDKDQVARLKKNKEAIEAIAKALKIDIKNLSANKSGTAESKEEKKLKRLISTLRTLQDQYEKLKALGASDDSIKQLFKGLYPDLIAEQGEAFVTDLKFLERGVQLANKLKALNKEAGKRALVDLGADGFTTTLKTLEMQNKAYKESAKAAGEYYNELRKWATEDFHLNGEGIALDVSKIASDLNGKISEIELRAAKAMELFDNIDVNSEEEVAKVKDLFVKEFGAGAWEEFWNDYYQRGGYAIEELASKQKEYEKKLAQERVNDLAEKYVKESYFEGNIEVTDLADRNFFQLRDMRKKLQALLNEEPLVVPIELENLLAENGVFVNELADVDLTEFFDRMEIDNVPISEANQEMLLLIQSIQKAGLSTEQFGETIKKVIGGDLKNLTQDEAKELMSMVQSYMGEMQKLMTSIGEYAELIGSDRLQGAMQGIVESIDILGTTAEKLSRGDWVGAIVSWVTNLASSVITAVSAQQELKNAIAETRAEMILLNSQMRIEDGVDTIFGTDDYGKFQNAYEEVKKAHADAIKDLDSQNQRFWGGSKDNWGLGGVLGGLAGGAGLGAAIGSIFPGIGTAIGAGVGALVGMITGLVGHAATAANDYAISLKGMADSINADLIDEETGGFNVETLKKIKSTYKDLDKEYKNKLDKLIAHAEVYQNAITEMATFMTDIFGQCADDMADSFINSFKESGQAALEYGDIMDGLATDIAKSIIKSTLLENVFSEEDAKKAAVELASGNAAGALSVVDDAMQAAQDMAPNIQRFLESLQPYFEMGEMEGQSLGDGIKGITEDTASLLASYLNAIRADVSYARTIWARMDVTTRQIMMLVARISSPSLMEYQAQIAANTFNTALYTQSIMEDLKSVITSESGFTAIRVYS